MFRVLFFSCLALSCAHAVLPFSHSAVAPIVPYSRGYNEVGLGHGYPGHGVVGHGYTTTGHLGYVGQNFIGHDYGHGLVNHGYGAHHVLKRSPHFVPVGLGHGSSVGHQTGHLGVISHVAPVVAPVAVSHQSRLDIRSSPGFAAPVLSVVNPAVAPLVHAAPVHHTPLAHYGGGHYGSAYSHLGHY